MKNENSEYSRSVCGLVTYRVLVEGGQAALISVHSLPGGGTRERGRPGGHPPDTVLAS